MERKDSVPAVSQPVCVCEHYAFVGGYRGGARPGACGGAGRGEGAIQNPRNGRREWKRVIETHIAVSRLCCPLPEWLSALSQTRRQAFWLGLVWIDEEEGKGKETDCWVWIREEALVGESYEQGGLSHCGVACGVAMIRRREMEMK